MSLHNLGGFIKRYAEFHKTKPHFKCKLAFYSGPTREVELQWLESLNLVFKYIQGDNVNNYERTMKEIQLNKTVYFIAKPTKLLERTSLPKEGYAYVHVVFDKLPTPFDNCIDLKLILYEEVMPIKQSNHKSIFDDLNRVELETLLEEIHKKGYVLNTLHIGHKNDQEANLVFASFHRMKMRSTLKEQETEFKKFQKMMNDMYNESTCLSGLCGCTSIF